MEGPDPYILVISLQDKDGNEIIEGIMGELPAPNMENGLKTFQWKIDNKYYRANVKLCLVDTPHNISSEILDRGEAVLIFIDAKQKCSLDEVKEIVPQLNDNEPEVKLLICESFTGKSGLTQLEAQRWCIDNGWELIELHIEDSESTDQFDDAHGYERIKQSLDANQWSSMVMQGSHGMYSGNLLQRIPLIKDGRTKVTSDGNSSRLINAIGTEYIDTMTDSTAQLNLPDDYSDSTTNVEFDQLYSSFNKFKLEAETMSTPDRHRYAEKVAIAFWRAFNVDEDEVEGLESSDEEELKGLKE